MPSVPGEVWLPREFGESCIVSSLCQRRGSSEAPEPDQRITLAQQEPGSILI